MKKGEILLFIGSFIWGSAFVAQSVAMNDIEPWTFNFMRSIIAVLTLTIIIPFFNKNRNKTNEEKKNLIIGGLVCGTFLCAASITQQIGISMTTVGKAGFITAMYVVLVPVFNIFFGKKAKPMVWISVILASCGLYFLSIAGTSFSIETADIYVIACAILFAFQIISVDHFSPLLNGMELSRAQFMVMGIISFFFMIIFEHPNIEAISNAMIPILYTGVLSSGIAYTFQVIGQRDTDPAIASLIMSFESCFAALSGFILLHQTLTINELIGCALMFLAIVVAQMDDLLKNKKKGAVTK